MKQNNVLNNKITFSPHLSRTLFITLKIYGILLIIGIVGPILLQMIEYLIGQLIGCNLSGYTGRPYHNLTCQGKYGFFYNAIEQTTMYLYIGTDIIWRGILRVMYRPLGFLFILSLVYTYVTRDELRKLIKPYKQIVWMTIGIATIYFIFVMIAFSKSIYVFEYKNYVFPPKSTNYSQRQSDQFIKPQMIKKNNRYVHELLGFSLPATYENEQQSENNYGKSREIQFFISETGIFAGYMYGKQGQNLEIEELVYARLRKDETLLSTSFSFNGFPAVRVDKTNVQFPNDTTYSIAAINRNGMMYVLFAKTPDSLGTILRDFRFEGTNVPTANEISGPNPLPKYKEEAKLFFPVPDKATSVTLPTLTGKIRQVTTELLPSEFLIDSPSYNFDDPGFMIRYKPGRITNALFYLDGIQITDIFGYPQYPTVQCAITHKNVSGSTYSDSAFYKYSRNTEPLISKEECLAKKADMLPPVVFYIKPTSALDSGTHTLRIEINKNIQEFSFIIDSSINSMAYTSDEVKLDDIDNCMRGYYYDKTYFHIPLPLTENPDFLYGISFPQNGAEKGSIQRKRVHIRFEDKNYDLMFPQSSLFYFSGEKNTYENRTQLNPWQALYIPLDYLYYGNETPAKLWVTPGYSSSEYMELFPIDLNSNPLRKSIPWQTSGSSACDG